MSNSDTSFLLHTLFSIADRIIELPVRLNKLANKRISLVLLTTGIYFFLTGLLAFSSRLVNLTELSLYILPFTLSIMAVGAYIAKKNFFVVFFLTLTFITQTIEVLKAEILLRIVDRRVHAAYRRALLGYGWLEPYHSIRIILEIASKEDGIVDLRHLRERLRNEGVDLAETVMLVENLIAAGVAYKLTSHKIVIEEIRRASRKTAGSV